MSPGLHSAWSKGFHAVSFPLFESVAVAIFPERTNNEAPKIIVDNFTQLLYNRSRFRSWAG